MMFIQQSLGGWRTALLLGLTTLLLAPAEGMEDLNLESRVGYEGRHKIIEDLNYYVKAERRERIRSKYGLTGVECPNTVRIMERHGREVCGNELGTKRIHHSRAMVYDNKVACKRCTDFCLPHMDRFAKPCCVAGMKEDGEITCGCRTSVCEECGEPRTQCDQSTWVSHSLHWPPQLLRQGRKKRKDTKHVLQTCQSAPTAVCPGITTPSDTRLCSLWMTQSVITKWQKNTNSDTRRLLCPLQVKTPSTHPPTSVTILKCFLQKELTANENWWRQVVLDSAVSYHLCTVLVL